MKGTKAGSIKFSKNFKKKKKKKKKKKNVERLDGKQSKKKGGNKG